MPNEIIKRRILLSGLRPGTHFSYCSFFFNAVVSEYIDWGDNLDSQINSGIFSVRAIVRRTATGSTREIFTKWNGTTNNRTFTLRFNSSNNIVFAMSNDGTASQTQTTTNTFTSTTTWYDIVAVVNINESTNANRVKIYVNDSLQAVTTSGTFTNPFNGGSAIRIGTSGDGLNPYVGYINQVGITSDVITSSEVTKLYNLGLPKRLDDVCNNIILLPHFDTATFDSVNWSVPDLSVSNLTGTSNLLLSADRDCNENPY